MPWVVTLTILVASAFLMDMSFTMITPFLPVYLSSELGAKASEVDMWSGAVFAVTFFVSGLLGPVWGVLADRKSRKLMALRASIGLTIMRHCSDPDAAVCCAVFPRFVRRSLSRLVSSISCLNSCP